MLSNEVILFYADYKTRGSENNLNNLWNVSGVLPQLDSHAPQSHVL